jgi:hypothetical protein
VSDASTMDRYGLRSSTPRRPAHLPKLALPVLRSSSPRALRAGRRPAHHRRGSSAGALEPRARSPARLGQPLRCPEPRAHRRGAHARTAHPARLDGRGAPWTGLRRGPQRLEPLRGGGQSGTGGYYYHPSRHSAGQPIVAGWAYQLWSPGFPSSATRWSRPWRRGASRRVRRRTPTTWRWGRLRICWTACRAAASHPCSSSMRATIPPSCSAPLRDTAPTFWCGCTPTAPSTPTRKRPSRG